MTSLQRCLLKYWHAKSVKCCSAEFCRTQLQSKGAAGNNIHPITGMRKAQRTVSDLVSGALGGFHQAGVQMAVNPEAESSLFLSNKYLSYDWFLQLQDFGEVVERLLQVGDDWISVSEYLSNQVLSFERRGQVSSRGMKSGATKTKTTT